MVNDKFYCYSNRMRHFIQSFNYSFETIGVNKTTNAKYWIFQKSERLDKIIHLYNEVKHSV